MTRLADPVVAVASVVASATGATGVGGVPENLLVQYGALGVMLLYFMFRDYRREERANQREDQNRQRESEDREQIRRLVDRLMENQGGKS